MCVKLFERCDVMKIVLPPAWKASNEAKWVGDLEWQTTLKIQVNHLF